MLIRKFKRGDIFTVMRLVNEIFQEDYDPQILFGFYNEWQDGFIVAEENNEILGLVVGSLPEPTRARILILAVEEPYRNKGIGSQLLQVFLNECIIRGVKLVTLEVRVSNLGAIEFYKKRKFFIVQIIPHYYKDGEDGYVMQKLL
ncbi:MAG: GNAT family N-acetyltransferase [Candidatus Thermoplasmatota archaeon]|nr:GNAT family N-acetyltransferase [Candidatus Thermoplasmatota archaeon]